MAVFKCKMCGGDLDVREGMSIGTCQFCGSTMTLPRLDDDRKANLYDRANHFRRNNEYDKAASLYEMILNEDKTDAEAYWSLVLCKYGIVYVEDPATRKRIPTCNRTQFTSIFTDENYKQAIAHADARARTVYEAEAANIDAIQKGILAISSREEPFDVFICYKEQDAKGNRTPDSVLAQDLYYQLGAQGFRVFFARITLEDKLGTAYEPYIFAALQSAKIMVVLGTSPEHFNAPWVKNEWSRFLSLIRDGGSKMLVPAYRDMDPYDLPADFSHLQALDMSKLGFMQDLVRGIQKILQKPAQSAVAPTQAVPDANTVEPLLKRAFMFIGDGDFNNATDYCERVLDRDPENAKAYIGKLLIELRLRNEEQLGECAESISEYDNFQKALHFSDPKYRIVLEGYRQAANNAMEIADKERHEKRKINENKARTKLLGAYKKVKICVVVLLWLGVLEAIFGNLNDNRSNFHIIVMLGLISMIACIVFIVYGIKLGLILYASGARSFTDVKRLLSKKPEGLEDIEEAEVVVAETVAKPFPSDVVRKRPKIPQKAIHRRSIPKVWYYSSFLKYITPVFQSWKQFEGRATRKDFSYFILINFCYFFVSFHLSYIIHPLLSVEMLYGWIMLVSLFSLWVRRLHDMGHSGIIAMILPVFQLLIFFYTLEKAGIYYELSIPVFFSRMYVAVTKLSGWDASIPTTIASIIFFILLVYSMLIPGQNVKNRYGPTPLPK